MLHEYEIIVAYGSYRVGDRIRPVAMLRNQLLARKWIRKVEPEPVAVVAAEASTDVPPVEPPVQKRGRRRKSKGDQPC